MTKIAKRPMRKVWLVAHPIGQFHEDVKMLAMSKNLKIVDVKFADTYPEEMLVKNPPKLTSKLEEQKAAAALAAEEAEIEAKVKAEAAEIAELERKTRLEVEVRTRVMKEMADEAKK